MVLKRILFIAIIMIVINAILISPIYAMGDVIQAGKNFLAAGNKVEDMIEAENLKSTSDFIFNMFLVVAIVAAVGVGTVLGIKFITSSVEGQAKIKEALIPYVVGCIVIFAAFPIWSFIVDAGENAVGIEEEEITKFPVYRECQNCDNILKFNKEEWESIYWGNHSKDEWIKAISTVGKCDNCGAINYHKNNNEGLEHYEDYFYCSTHEEYGFNQTGSNADLACIVNKDDIYDFDNCKFSSSKKCTKCYAYELYKNGTRICPWAECRKSLNVSFEQYYNNTYMNCEHCGKGVMKNGSGGYVRRGGR